MWVKAYDKQEKSYNKQEKDYDKQEKDYDKQKKAYDKLEKENDIDLQQVIMNFIWDLADIKYIFRHEQSIGGSRNYATPLNVQIEVSRPVLIPTEASREERKKMNRAAWKPPGARGGGDLIRNRRRQQRATREQHAGNKPW